MNEVVTRQPRVSRHHVADTLRREAISHGEPLVCDGVRADLCPGVVAAILARAARTRGIGSLNVGGWKSPEDFFAWPDTAVRELAAEFAAQLGEMPIGWAMINGPGALHRRHQHRIAIVSGVYYLDESKTPTLFETKAGPLEIEPYPGRLVVFPGETWHEVPPVVDQQRVTIAFDVRR